MTDKVHEAARALALAALTAAGMDANDDNTLAWAWLTAGRLEADVLAVCRPGAVMRGEPRVDRHQLAALWRAEGVDPDVKYEVDCPTRTTRRLTRKQLVRRLMKVHTSSRAWAEGVADDLDKMTEGVIGVGYSFYKPITYAVWKCPRCGGSTPRADGYDYCQDCYRNDAQKSARPFGEEAGDV